MGQKLLFCFLMQMTTSSFAIEQENAVNDCQKPNEPNKLFWCLVRLSPEVQIQSADINVKNAAVSQASQMINPEFSFQTTDDKSVGGPVSEVSLLHTFELGGKRGARKDLAKTEKKISETLYLSELEGAARRTAVKIHRLRQILTEIELIEENIETYRNILKQYRRIGRLNPEQSVSSSVFEIAEEENALKKESLSQERKQIEAEFSSVLGIAIQITSGMLPELKAKWPSVEATDLKGSEKTILESEVDLAKSNLELEKSQSWPDLSVGPRVERIGGNVNDTYYGVAVSVPLPFLSLNRGGRAKGASELEKAKLRESLHMRRLNSKANLLLQSYESSTKSIERAMKRVNIKKSHQDLHKLLSRGIVNAALVIELHREVYDYYGRLHEQELVAVQSLWTLYALNGSLKNERL